MDAAASEKIYAAKGRPSDNPLIVHIARMEDLEKIVTEVPKKAKILAEACWPGPLTMILPKSEEVPYETTGGLDSVAVRYPSHPVAQALILAAGGYVAAPSANTSGRPSPTTAAHVQEDLTGAVDMIWMEAKWESELSPRLWTYRRNSDCAAARVYLTGKAKRAVR